VAVGSSAALDGAEHALSASTAATAATAVIDRARGRIDMGPLSGDTGSGSICAEGVPFGTVLAVTLRCVEEKNPSGYDIRTSPLAIRK
jgi:hypothetical protein